MPGLASPGCLILLLASRPGTLTVSLQVYCTTVNGTGSSTGTGTSTGIPLCSRTEVSRNYAGNRTPGSLSSLAPSHLRAAFVALPMDAARECSSCGSGIDGPSCGTCETCKESSPDAGDGALCGNCLALHEKGVSGKGLTRGHKYAKADDTRAEAIVAVLSRAGLAACPTRCAEHSKAVDIACTTCQEPALCVLCLSKHTGHTFLVLAETAPVVRVLMRLAVAGLPGPGADAPGPATIEAARTSARRIAAERDALPSRVEAAAARIHALRDNLISVVTARHDALCTELAAKAAEVDAALASCSRRP